ncbi:MAG: hypothetical protein ACREBJ_11710, partial [Nitrosotalea sp.]
MGTVKIFKIQRSVEDILETVGMKMKFFGDAQQTTTIKASLHGGIFDTMFKPKILGIQTMGYYGCPVCM